MALEQGKLAAIDRQIIGDLYLSTGGADFVEEIVNRFGSRFNGTDEERAAADYIVEVLKGYGVDKAWKEAYPCNGWTRKPVKLTVTAPVNRAIDAIALPFCPPGVVEAPLVYLGDGDPQTYADNADKLKGAIAMVNTANPRFFHRGMHRGEKLGRALKAGAVGFIWMRGEPGGLPETGSARFNQACEVPAISVSFESGHEMLRLARQGQLKVRIESECSIAPTISYNVIGEITGRSKPAEVIVIGGHYDGHDVSQSAADNGAGTAVVLQAARALAPHKEHMARTIRFIAFGGEEMGLIGSYAYVDAHKDENFVFMLNLDGAGRGARGTFSLQNWSENTAFFKAMFRDIHEAHVTAGDTPSLYSDMYPFAAQGFPAASYTSSDPVSGGAPRGYGHTYWDSLDKLNPRAIQLDSIFVARLTGRMATIDEVPLKRKTPAALGARLRQMGLDEVLKYELRPVPGEE